MAWSKVLIDLMVAPSWRECQFIVERHPEVLFEHYDEELLELIRLAESQSPRDCRIAQELRSVLQRCREVGVAKAFDEKVNNVVNDDFGRILPYPDYFTEAELLRLFIALRDGNQEDIGRMNQQMGDRGIALTIFITDYMWGDGSKIRAAIKKFPALMAVFDPTGLEHGRNEIGNIAPNPKEGRKTKI